jgi:hypothetical protein
MSFAAACRIPAKKREAYALKITYARPVASTITL